MLYLLPCCRDDAPIDTFGRLVHINDAGTVRMVKAGFYWAMDNNMFTGNFREHDNPKDGRAFLRRGFWSMLEYNQPVLSTCLFVVCPDVIGDAPATMMRWKEYAPRIRAMGYKVAFAAQDGQENLPLPDDYDALFIGGSTPFKYSDGVKRMVAEAKAQGEWTHMGRVNSLKRILYCRQLGIDSVDGTHLIYEPDKAIERLKYWMMPERVQEARAQMAMVMT